MKDHWDILCNHHNHHGNDLLCSIIYNASNGHLLSKDVVSNPQFQKRHNITEYVMYIPSDLLLAKICKEVQTESICPDLIGVTLTQSQNIFHQQKESKKLSVQLLPYDRRIQVITKLATAFSANTSHPHEDEDLAGYLERRGQRDGITACYWKNGNSLKLKMETSKKKIHQQYLLEQKWGKNIVSELGKDFKFWRKQLEKELNSDSSDVLSKINQVIKEESKYDTTIWSRRLGYFHTIYVNLETKKTTCNCELFNFVGTCLHTRVISLVEFDNKPPTQCMDTNGTIWKEVREHYYKSITSTIFKGKSNDILEQSADKNWHSVFPTVDPNS